MCKTFVNSASNQQWYATSMTNTTVADAIPKPIIRRGATISSNDRAWDDVRVVFVVFAEHLVGSWCISSNFNKRPLSAILFILKKIMKQTRKSSYGKPQEACRRRRNQFGGTPFLARGTPFPAGVPYSLSELGYPSPSQRYQFPAQAQFGDTQVAARG